MIKDSWKDELLARAIFTKLDIAAIPLDHLCWMQSFPKVFVYYPNVDCWYNLLHKDNAAILWTRKTKGI